MIDSRSILHPRKQANFQLYVSHFLEFQNTISKAKETFSQTYIWPDQCEFIIYRVELLQKIIGSIANINFLSTKKRIGASSQSRYQLLVSFHHFEFQAENLVRCIREYKEIEDGIIIKKLKHKLIISSLHDLDSSLCSLMNELNEIILVSS